MKYEKLLRLVESEIYSRENLSTWHWSKFRGIGPKSPPPFCTETKGKQHRRIHTLTDVKGFENALRKLNEKENV